jgi:hypothetical protein
MNKNRSPWCFEDYVEVLSESETDRILKVEDGTILSGYVFTNIGFMYKNLVEDEGT